MVKFSKPTVPVCPVKVKDIVVIPVVAFVERLRLDICEVVTFPLTTSVNDVPDDVNMFIEVLITGGSNITVVFVIRFARL